MSLVHPHPGDHGGGSSGTSFGLDARTLEIKTKSIEHTLVPLVSQITTLVNFKESYLTNGKPKSERAIRSALKVGSAVEAAIERFVAVGETIADENPDIQPEMYDACHEARLAGTSIANLSFCSTEVPDAPILDKSVLVRASRQLLSSVTRVLLLADRVLVKHILRAEDKVAYSLSRLEVCRSFTEFVKIFAEFGGEMVDLAHRSGDRQHDLKSEKRKAQMGVARTSLERHTMLLLTSSKTLLRHPDSKSALQCRDGVFDQEMLEMVRMTFRVGVGVRERLIGALDALCEMTQDFTDSAYTPHHHREQILDFLEECRFEMTNLILPEEDSSDHLRSDSIDVTVERLNRRLKDLGKQLQIVAMDHVSETLRANEDQVLLSSIKACAVAGDIDGVERYMDKFREHAEHMQEVCRLLHHISLTDALHVNTGHCERNMRSLAPLVNDLSRLAKESDSAACGRVAAEKQAYMSLPRPGVSSGDSSSSLPRFNGSRYVPFRFFKHSLESQTVTRLLCDSDDSMSSASIENRENHQNRNAVLSQGGDELSSTASAASEDRKAFEYRISLILDDLRSKHGTTSKPSKPITLDIEAMSSMAYNMYLFTRGDGPLKTTHDLFTQAEFFAEQANKMYKTVREFSYEATKSRIRELYGTRYVDMQVPASAEKSELSTILERIPVHCQQLQVLVKSPTVGKSATFGKVDSVIQETKNLMNEIAKLVTSSFVCATKYEIEFRGGSIPRVVGDGGAELRTSRESTVWRRTPSIRRTAPPPVNYHQH
ncbi:unnamed protein product [Angiostrongylus costaricensis]|uniref:Alpha-catulin n=1 Tax=Angiostrongylus costaricensis TaxID=334426 RepID=A0A158PIM7_ANGCS|nr:unnamed protein product [Angiostrongylus costaricensis]